MTSKNLVLRTVYIDPEVDDLLRNEAFAGRTSKNDLFRKYLRLGMQVARSAEQGVAAPPKTVTAKVKATATPSSKAAVKSATKRVRTSPAA